ncbi:hypothetical protein ACVW0Y_004758, partial [Pseudomonas sp. TE3786]
MYLTALIRVCPVLNKVYTFSHIFQENPMAQGARRSQRDYT